MHLTAQQTLGLTEASLRQFVELAIPEGLYLDYKLELSGQSDRESKREFLKDVTAFANSAGGTLLLGVREPASTRSIEEQLVGIENGVGLAQSLERLTSTSIDPRIPGLHLVAVPLGTGSACVIVHIPPSRARPHMVHHDGHRSFYVRHSESSLPMTTHEIREAVLTSSSAEARARDIIAEQLLQLRAHFDGVPTLFLQAVPLISPESPWDVFGKAIEEVVRSGTRKNKFNYFDLVTGVAPLPTIDGVLTRDQREDPEWVLEVHRNGYVSLRSHIQEHSGEDGDDYVVHSGVVHSGVCDVFGAFCYLLNELMAVSNTDVPYAIASSCLAAEGVCMWTESRTKRFSKPFGKPEITWPLHLRDTGTDACDVAKAMSTELFNAFGFQDVVG